MRSVTIHTVKLPAQFGQSGVRDSERLADSHPKRYNVGMSSAREIKEAIRRLEPSELEAFRAWFVEFDAESWDCEMEADVAAGRLDRLADEALADLREGRCTDL